MNNSMRFFIFGGLLLTLILSCSSNEEDNNPLIVEDNFAHLMKKDVHTQPFEGELELYMEEVMDYPPNPNKIKVVIGAGCISELGNTGFLMKKRNNDLHHPPCIAPWSGSGVGDISFSAENGDLLLAYFSNALCFHESKTKMYVTFTGQFLHGGTGKFKNAKGDFYFEGICNPTTKSGTATISGEIQL